jgi:hypothetical protein
MQAVRRWGGGGGVVCTGGWRGWGAADRTGGRRGRQCGRLELTACITLLHGDTVAPPSAATYRRDSSMRPHLPRQPLGCVAALQPSFCGRHWLGKHRCCHSGHCCRSPRKPRCRASRCGGVGRSCRGRWGSWRFIDDLGRPISVFITLTNPFGFFAVASHSRMFSTTSENEKGVSQLERGCVLALSNSELHSSTAACYMSYMA